MSTIEKIFQELDGKYAVVSCGGLHVEASLEQAVLLKFVRYRGLEMFSSLSNNATKPEEHLIDSLRKGVIPLGDIFDKAYSSLVKKIETAQVRMGHLSYYGVTAQSITFNKDGNIAALELEYGKSIVSVRVRSDYY